jgi:hypothetical protein
VSGPISTRFGQVFEVELGVLMLPSNILGDEPRRRVVAPVPSFGADSTVLHNCAGGCVGPIAKPALDNRSPI